MGLWARFRRSRAIRSYLTLGPQLLRRRYGLEPHYSPKRVLAMLSAERLDVEFAVYACALFSLEVEFVDWVLDHRERGRARFESLPPTTRAEAHELYRALREETATRYNHGKHEFLPQTPPPWPTDGGPLEVSTYVGGTAFRWYK
jgi:hypothetical protein